jgi:muconolactone D-isomerase
MEFLVHISIVIPQDMPDDERQRRYDAETRQAAALASAGQLVRLWRVPGRTANWGLWRARDATELHQALTSLPLWPFMDIEVTPLAEHPNDPAREVSAGPGR